MIRKISCLVAALAVLASAHPAAAQQEGKVYRIGILQVNDFSKSPMGPAFVQERRQTMPPIKSLSRK